MTDSCSYLMKLEGPEDELQRFDKQGRADHAGKDVLMLFKLIPVTKTVHFQGWGDYNMGEYLDFNIHVVYDESLQSYYFSEKHDIGEDIFIEISEAFPRIKFVCEYKNFRYEDNAIADYKRFICQNRSIEVTDQYKIRCKLCPLCGSIESFEKM